MRKRRRKRGEEEHVGEGRGEEGGSSLTDTQRESELVCSRPDDPGTCLDPFPGPLLLLQRLLQNGSVFKHPQNLPKDPINPF